MQKDLLPLFVVGHNSRYTDRMRWSKKREKRATQLPGKRYILQRYHDTETKEIRGKTRGAESEPESESPGVVAPSQESESESESIKLPRLRLRNVLFESVI